MKEITEVKMGRLHYGMKLSGPDCGLLLMALESLKKDWADYKYQDMKDAVDNMIVRVQKVDQRYKDLRTDPDIRKVGSKED